MTYEKFATLLCLLALTACNATTRLSGFVDPQYTNNYQAKKMIVMGFGMSIEEQKALEATVAQSFSTFDVQLLSGLNTSPPRTRDFSAEEVYQIATQQGADSLLIITTEGRDVTETYVPQQYHAGSSTSYVTGYGNYATVNTYTSPRYTTGGYNLSKPKMKVSAHLKDTANGATVWTAEGSNSGSALSSFSDLTISVAQTAVKELSTAGLIRQKQTQ